MNTIEYFAIGSMMNPVSLKMRGLNPKKSRPGVLKGYRLIFVMANGYAAARKCDTTNGQKPTDEIHGVLHTLTTQKMNKLDTFESSYVKGIDATIELYQEDTFSEKLYEQSTNLEGCKNVQFPNTKLVRGRVYVLNDEIVSMNPEKFAINPPSERYIDILKEGATYFGIKEDYIRRLFIDINIVQRPPVAKLKKVPVPDNFFSDSFPAYTLEETARTLSYMSEASTYWYDPKYGIPLTYNEMNPDHRAEVEHILVNSFMSGEDWRRWEVIGRIILK